MSGFQFRHIFSKQDRQQPLMTKVRSAENAHQVIQAFILAALTGEVDTCHEQRRAISAYLRREK